MNKDIRLDVFFLKNLKTKKSRKKHGADFILCLIDLWSYCAVNFPKGVLIGVSNEDVDLIVEWCGDGFCEKAISDGWIDIIDGDMHLHGWEERQGYAMFAEERSEKARNASKARWEKKNTKNQDLEELENANSNATSIQQAMLENADSNAPSPSPSPSPNKYNNARSENEVSPHKQDDVAGYLPLNDNTEFAVLKDDVEKWQDIYQNCDVIHELKKMKEWLNNNPSKRKTRRGVKNFINSWLDRQQNKGRAI